MGSKVLIGICCSFFVVSLVAAGGWVDDWFDQTSGGSGTSQSVGKNNYHVGASFNGRVSTKSDPLFSISPPRLKVGCGGINAFMGGLGFADTEYLVKKLERILKSTPLAAFDIALNVLCPQCSQTMAKIENMINKLNSLQLDECAASKAMVAYSLQSVSENPGLGEVTTKFKQDSGVDDLWQGFAEEQKSNNGQADTTTMNSMLSSCSPKIRQYFSKEGYLLENIREDFGYLQSHINLVRGLFGDIYISHNQNKGINATIDKPCPANGEFNLEKFMAGDVISKTIGDPKDNAGRCQQDGGRKVNQMQWAYSTLESIASKQQSKGSLTVNELSFLNRNVLPIQTIVDSSLRTKTDAAHFSLFSAAIAKGYSERMLDDLFTRIKQMLETAAMVRSKSQSGSDTKHCSLELLTGSMDGMVGIQNKLQEATKSLREQSTAMDSSQFTLQQVLNGLSAMGGKEKVWRSKLNSM